MRWYLISRLGPLALVGVALAVAAVAGLWRFDLGMLDRLVPACRAGCL